MGDTAQRVIAAGDRAVTQPADRVLEDRFTAYDREDDELHYTDDDAGGGGGGSGGASVSLPPPWGKALDARLEKVDARHPLQAAVDVVAASKANKGMAFALVDLTTPGKRLYASLRDGEQRYIASMGKLCILFAAFQLRAAARAAAALVDVKTAKTPDKLFATITRAWSKPIGKYFRGGKGADNSLPALARIFTPTPSASGAWDVAFNTTSGVGQSSGDAFFSRLLGSVLHGENAASASCIRDIGFPYINGALAEAGLWRRGKGMWISLDFGGHHWDPEAAGQVSPHASTARALAEFLTLLAFDELVPGSGAEMLDSMAGEDGTTQRGHGTFLAGGALSRLKDDQKKTLLARGKVGYLDAGPYNDCALIEHDSPIGRLRFVGVMLGGSEIDHMIKTGRALDVAFEGSRSPPPP